MRRPRTSRAIFGVIAGRDPRDSTSAAAPVPDYAAALTGDVRGLRIGVPRELLGDGVEPGVLAALRRGARRRCATPAPSLSDIALPHAPLAIPVYYLVANAEASSNLARYDGVRYGTRADGDDAARRLLPDARAVSAPKPSAAS